MHVLECDDALAAAPRLRKAKMNRLLRGLGCVDAFHACDFLQLALRARRHAGLGAKAVGESLQPVNFALLVLMSRELLNIARRALHEVFVEVAAVPVQLAAFHRNDAVAEQIEKFPIVRDE